MTITYLTQPANVTLDNNGNGQVVLQPAQSQYWMPTFMRVGTASQAFPIPNCTVYHGSPGKYDATTFVDSTVLGNNDTSSIISGSVAQFGDAITAVFTGGNPNDSAFLNVVGQVSDTPPGAGAFPQVPGARFTGFTKINPYTQATGSPWAQGPPGGSRTFAVPTLAQAIIIIVSQPIALTSMIVVGNSSGAEYLSMPTATDQSPNGIYWVPIVPGLDSAVNITVTNTSAETIRVLYSYDPIVTSLGIASSPINVTISDIRQYPNQTPLKIDTGSLASNAVANILPATPGRTYRIFEININGISGNTSSFNIQDTNSNTLHIGDPNVTGTISNTVIPVLNPINWNAAALPAGVGLQLMNSGAANSRWVGSITYSF